MRKSSRLFLATFLVVAGAFGLAGLLAPVVSAALEPYREAGIYLRRDGSGFRGEAAVIVDPAPPSPPSTPGKTEPRQERRGF